MRRFKFSVCTLFATVFSIFVSGLCLGQSKTQEGLDFRIFTDSKTYKSTETIRVYVLAVNTGTTALYFRRNLIGCSSPEGFVSIEVIDTKTRKDVTDTHCSADTIPTQDSELEGKLNSPHLWIKLEPAQAYGERLLLNRLPPKAAIYELKATLFPTSLTEKQKRVLSEKGIHVLLNPITAPTLRINIRSYSDD